MNRVSNIGRHRAGIGWIFGAVVAALFAASPFYIALPAVVVSALVCSTLDGGEDAP